VLVGAWDYKKYHNVEFPELFLTLSKSAPANIELAHLNHYTKEQAKDGLRVIEAARTCRASYMGFHGYPDEWLEKYYYVTEYLANRLGYWYFINSVAHNDCALKDAPLMLEFEWENRGFAPCYTKYEMKLKFRNNDYEYICAIPEFDNTEFMEDQKYIKRYLTRIPKDMPAGIYDISVGIFEAATNTSINLAIKNEYKDQDGFYRISQIEIR